MTLKILDVRIGQVGVEASRASLEKAAPGPLGGIGYSLAYKKAFAGAQAGGAGHALPWDSQKPYLNKFWRKYVTDRMLSEDPKQWPDVAWNLLVPFKATAALPLVHLHPDELRTYSESYAWPTGVGLIWNSSIRTSTDVDGLVSILADIRNGKISYEAADGTTGPALPMKTLYHQMLDSVRDQLWDTQQKGQRSDPMTIVSIVQAEADPADPKAVPDALQRLLDGIAREWNDRPVTLPGDVRAASGGTVYAAEGLRLAWVPANFLSQSRGRPGNCLHRNLLLASMQVEMLAAAARMLAAHKRNNGLPGHFQSTVERVLEGSAAVLSGESYSAPHLRAQLERQPVAHALSELSES